MGGLNEKIISSSPVAMSQSVRPVTGFRIHENKGEVHIHDDDNHKKVAVDAAYFRSAWGKFILLPNEQMTLIGKDGKTAALFVAVLTSNVPDVAVSIVDIDPQTNLSKICDFVAGK